MGILDSIMPKKGGNTRALALTVLGKNLDDKDPLKSSLDVKDAKGNTYKLLSRNDQFPVDEIKVKAGGMIIAEGAYLDKDAAEPTLNARWFAAPVPEANSGTIITGAARLVKGFLEGQVDIQVIDAPMPVNTKDEAVAAITAAMEKNRDSGTWPVAAINVRVGESEGRTRQISAASIGEVGDKKPAAVEAQVEHVKDRVGKWLDEVMAIKAANPDANVEVEVAAIRQISLGKDSSEAISKTVVMGGAGEEKATRNYPREKDGYTKDDREFAIFKFIPAVIGLQYKKNKSTGEFDPNSQMIGVKFTPVFSTVPEHAGPSSSYGNWSSLSKVIAAVNEPPRLSDAQSVASETQNDLPDDDLDQLEASMSAAAAAPSI